MATKYVKPNNSELKFAYRLLLYLHANVNNTYLLLAIIAWARINNNAKQVFYSSNAAIDRAVRATASKLKSSRKYDLTLKALRRDGGEKDYSEQAMDFLLAIIASPWQKDHYGTTDAQRLDPNGLYATSLYAAWAILLGHSIKLPADTIPQPKPKPPPPAPHQPRTLKHTIVIRDYIQPYAAISFYESRHKAPEGPPGDPRTTGL